MDIKSETRFGWSHKMSLVIEVAAVGESCIRNACKVCLTIKQAARLLTTDMPYVCEPLKWLM